METFGYETFQPIKVVNNLPTHVDNFTLCPHTLTLYDNIDRHTIPSSFLALIFAQCAHILKTLGYGCV